MKFTSALLVSFALFAASCSFTPSKHGPVKSEDRTITAFTRIESSGAVEIDFKTAEKVSVIVEAPDDILPHLATEVNNGTLNIHLTSEVNNLSQPVKVHLEGPSLEAAQLSGACSLDLLAPLNGKNFRIDLHGASSFEGTVYLKDLQMSLSGASIAKVAGMTNSFSAEATGASTLNGEKLSAVKAVVKSEGASNTSLRADSSLNAKASGASFITYTGDPVVLEKESSGASEIHKGK